MFTVLVHLAYCSIHCLFVFLLLLLFYFILFFSPPSLFILFYSTLIIIIVLLLLPGSFYPHHLFLFVQGLFPSNPILFPPLFEATARCYCPACSPPSPNLHLYPPKSIHVQGKTLSFCSVVDGRHLPPGPSLQNNVHSRNRP